MLLTPCAAYAAYGYIPLLPGGIEPKMWCYSYYTAGSAPPPPRCVPSSTLVPSHICCSLLAGGIAPTMQLRHTAMSSDSPSLLSLPMLSGGIEPEMLRYSYYTAGSGGAGPTILETSFLLAGEECTVYKDGQPYKLPPISNRRDVDFGPGVNLLAPRPHLYLLFLGYGFHASRGCPSNFCQFGPAVACKFVFTAMHWQ